MIDNTSESINENYIPGTDPHADNYNIDPNEDNYNFTTDSGFEGNGEMDLNNSADDGVWQVGDGEEWFDYGLDGTSDNYEQYLPENQIIVSTDLNPYEIDIQNFNDYSELDNPDFGENQVALWISSIEYNAVEEVYELMFSVYSERKLDGLKFNLGHPAPGSNLMVSWNEDYERHYIQNVSWHDYENDSGNITYEKMFKDYSIYPLHSLLSYSDILDDSLIVLNYSYDILGKIDSYELKNFVDNYSSGIISRIHSKIVIPIDTALTNFSESLLHPE